MGSPFGLRLFSDGWQNSDIYSGLVKVGSGYVKQARVIVSAANHLAAHARLNAAPILGGLFISNV